MTLTLGTGPLGTSPAGDFNFSLDGAPAHRLYFEPYPRRVRALVGDRVVLDSVRGRLLHESNVLPRLYVPLEDLDGTLLERSETSTHCPFKGDASYFTLAAGERMIEDAVWTYEEPSRPRGWRASRACTGRRPTRGSSRTSGCSATCATPTTASTSSRPHGTCA